MSKKKWYSLIAMLFIIVALILYLSVKKENRLHDFFGLPLLLSAVFLFAATRAN